MYHRRKVIYAAVLLGFSTADATMESCRVPAEQMTRGEFEIIDKKPATATCQVLPEIFRGLIKLRVESPGCFLMVKRLSGVPPQFNQAGTYKVYTQAECSLPVGSKATLYLSNNCCELYPNRCSLLPYPQLEKKADRGSAYACEDRQVWWVDDRARDRMQVYGDIPFSKNRSHGDAGPGD